MNTTFAKLTDAEFDSMVDCGAFDRIEGKKVELIRGELRFMNPVGPLNLDLQEKADIYAEAGVQEYLTLLKVGPARRRAKLSHGDGAVGIGGDACRLDRRGAARV